ncbi:MAG: SRPBCC family protein [Candidatus Promineifilaceae bacterium]
MVRNEKVIVINRPIAEVFAYVGDLQTGPQWQSALLEVRRATDGPLGIGSQFTSVRKFMGRKVEAGVEIVAYEPSSKLAIKSISGATPFEQSYLFESTAEGTRLTTVLELQTGGGLMGLADPLIAASVKREMDASFGDLKDLLESRVTAGA